MEITAAQIEQVLRTLDCVTCMLSRAQRLHRTLESGGDCDPSPRLLTWATLLFSCGELLEKISCLWFL